jgi:hypothetical protein
LLLGRHTPKTLHRLLHGFFMTGHVASALP